MAIEPSREQALREIYEAFAERDGGRMGSLVGDDFEFHAVTGERAGRSEPYRGPDGWAQYLEDVQNVWIELRVIPQRFEEAGNIVFVTGRVWARDADSLIDSPAAWVWQFAGERPTACEVFADKDEAEARFAQLTGDRA